MIYRDKIDYNDPSLNEDELYEEKCEEEVTLRNTDFDDDFV